MKFYIPSRCRFALLPKALIVLLVYTSPIYVDAQDPCECADEDGCDLKDIIPLKNFEERVTTRCTLDTGATTGTTIEIWGKSPETVRVLYSVCFDTVKEGTFYSNHTFNGGTSTPIDYNSWSKGALYTISPAKSYREECKRFGIHKGHLTPNADFTGTERISTYFYKNAHPQYAEINSGSGNWLKLETAVRTRQGPFQVLTGTFKEQRFIGESASGSPISGKLPVPKYTWKIIYSRTQSRGVAFVTINNPRTSTPFIPEFCPAGFCTNVCANIAWISHLAQVFENRAFGLTKCFSLDDFHKIINIDPTIRPYALWT